MFTIPQPHLKQEATGPGLAAHALHFPPPAPQWASSQQYQYLAPPFQDSPRPDQLSRTDSQDYEPMPNDARYAPRAAQDPRWQQTYAPRWEPRWEQDSHFQASGPSPQRPPQYPYALDDMGFPLLGTNVDPFQNFMYGGMPGFDPSLMKNMLLASDADMRKRGPSGLSNVLPAVMTGPRPYSPASAHPSFTMKGLNGPALCNQKIRVPSHLLLTEQQRIRMEEVAVVKRVFDADDPSTARVFLGQNGLLPEQLARPLNKWKTRNTRKRKHATTHLYQCCCGSDVKQFHGTKGTRRSKQKYPFVSCLAFVEVARRSEDGSLLWARGLLDHSPDCQKALPFASH